MARCLLADGRCRRLDRPCRSGQCIARTVRRLHDRRWRDKLGLFVAEGEDLVEASAEIEPVELLVAGETVEPELLAEVSALGHPPRVVGVFRRDDLPRGTRPWTIALWRVADPGNVGTLVRTADAFGAAVALSHGCADLTSPKALRASMGAVFGVPTAPFEEAPEAWVALVPRGGSPLQEVDLGESVTFVLGAEREGLPPEVLQRCKAQATIPQPGPAESLNVAAAGAIALYEAFRRAIQTVSSPPA
jgi:TrmH family RNA methyltransferase